MDDTRMNTTKRVIRFFCVISLTLASACRLTTPTAPTTHTKELIRGPYVQLATPDSIYVVWRTDGATTPIVRYGKSPGLLDHQVNGATILTRVAPDQGASVA